MVIFKRSPHPGTLRTQARDLPLSMPTALTGAHSPAEVLMDLCGRNSGVWERPLDGHRYGCMVGSMKTTVNLPDALLARAKKVALQRRVTLKTLLQRGLERELLAPSADTHPLDALQSLDPSLWKKTSADNYVKEQRAGWE